MTFDFSCQVEKYMRFYAIMKSNNKPKLVTLKSLREATGLTQPQLSVKMNCGLRSISDWENGKSLPRFDRAILLANELGVSLKELANAMNLDVSLTKDDTSQKQ